MPGPRGKQGLQYVSDFDSVAAVIGAIDAAEGLGRKDRYIGKLIDAAHDVAVDEFNTQIVADAMSTTTLDHMFEWGVTGINPASARRINPTSEAARLWRHTLSSTGRSKTIGFMFKPSVVPVPKPTTTKTGIAQKYLSRLKGNHVFWNKAFVMESGTTVTIEPKKANGKLFIPIKGLKGGNFRPADIKRGFIMTKGPVESVPGASSMGTFTAYWERFWNSMGNMTMTEHMERSFQKDLAKVVADAEKTRGAMTSTKLQNINGKVKTEKKKAEGKMMRSAESRARRNSE